jgi:hypothetical protein
LWGFEDPDGKWPKRYDGNDQFWQGYIAKDGKRSGWRDVLGPSHSLMLTMPVVKTPFTDEAFYCLIRNLFVRHTQDTGRIVPVSPHSFRHMLSKYLDELEIDDGELKSFSYVLHHSPETNKGKYVYRENMVRIAPAVKRMENILQTCVSKQKPLFSPLDLHSDLST